MKVDIRCQHIFTILLIVTIFVEKCNRSCPTIDNCVDCPSSGCDQCESGFEPDTIISSCKR